MFGLHTLELMVGLKRFKMPIRVAETGLQCDSSRSLLALPEVPAVVPEIQSHSRETAFSSNREFQAHPIPSTARRRLPRTRAGEC